MARLALVAVAVLALAGCGQKERGNAYLRDALQVYDALRARGAISAEYAAVPARIQSEMTK